MVSRIASACQIAGQIVRGSSDRLSGTVIEGIGEDMRAREIVHPEAAQAWSSATTSVTAADVGQGVGARSAAVMRSCRVVVIVLAILAFFGLR
jgi:hypothetical protein